MHYVHCTLQEYPFNTYVVCVECRQSTYHRYGYHYVVALCLDTMVSYPQGRPHFIDVYWHVSYKVQA